MERLYATAEGEVRVQIEHGLAVNQAAIEVRQRELASLEAERERLLRELPDAKLKE